MQFILTCFHSYFLLFPFLFFWALAGGFDAIFCITLSDEASAQVEEVWRTWSEMSVGPLLASEDSNGARIEDIEKVNGLAEVARH